MEIGKFTVQCSKRRARSDGKPAANKTKRSARTTVFLEK